MNVPAARESALPSELTTQLASPRASGGSDTPALTFPPPTGNGNGNGRPAPVDLRPRRDLFERRRWRERARAALRIGSLLLGDVLAVACALLLAALPFADVDVRTVTSAIPLAALLLVLFQAAGGMYGPGPARRRYERAALLAVAGAVAFLWVGHAYGLVALAPLRALIFTALLGGMASDIRLLGDLVARRLRRFGFATTPTLIIGAEARATEIAAHVGQTLGGHVRVMGRLEPARTTPTNPSLVNGSRAAVSRSSPCLLGSLMDLDQVLEAQDVRSVIISSRLETSELKLILRSCLLHGCSVALVPHALNELPCRVTSRDFLGWPLLELDVPRLHLVQTLAKRALDLSVSAFALVLLAPVLAILAITIRLESSGPILFRQRRLGVGGRPFTIYKFRTMHQDAERRLREDQELLELYRRNDYKLPPHRDPRITRLGRFLRHTSLDELPQLLNVLRGDMSLVGPRPIVPDEIERYGDHGTLFVAVRPGITGEWQVNGRSEVGYPERAEMDVEYIRGWSLAKDLTILAKTVPVVLHRNGAH